MFTWIGPEVYIDLDWSIITCRRFKKFQIKTFRYSGKRIMDDSRSATAADLRAIAIKLFGYDPGKLE